MEVFGDKARMIEQPSLQRILQVGIDHEEAVATRNHWLPIDDVPTPPAEATARQAADFTLQKMREGVPRIAQGLVRAGNWWGRPDWLVKRSGRSQLGAWYYAVEDAKAGSRRQTKRYHYLPVAFYSLILEKVQGRRPERFTLIRSDGDQEQCTEDCASKVSQVVDELTRILSERADPGPQLTSECTRCPWHEACRDDAERRLDLCLISGLRRATREEMKRRGIRDVRNLAEQSPDTISDLPFLRAPGAALRVVEQAKAYRDGLPRVAGFPLLSKPPRGVTEILIDFEGMGVSNSDDAILFGVLARIDGRCSYWSSVAKSPADIRRAWSRFVEKIVSYPNDATVFHYGNYELQVLRGLGRRSDLKVLAHRLVDLSPLIQTHAAIPDRGLGLKAVAGALGFSWRDPDVCGLTACNLWERWRQCDSDAPLRKLKRYNSDDLRATLLIRDWLVQFSGRDPTRRALRRLSKRAMTTARRRLARAAA